MKEPAPKPSLEEIEALAREAYTAIPAALRGQAADVAIRIEELPDAATCEEMKLESPFHLLGLYRGVPFGERSVLDAPRELDMIFLYRMPMLRYAEETGEDLSHLVRHVLIHEIGHHFGLSDEDMEAIENSV